MNERVELSVGSKVEQSARGVVGSGGESVSVGEEPEDEGGRSVRVKKEVSQGEDKVLTERR